MSEALPQAKRLADYQPPEFLIDTVSMRFELDKSQTLVKCESKVKRHGDHNNPLILDGENLTLITVLVDDVPFDKFQIKDGKLILPLRESSFTLSITTQIDPQANTSLEGLYLSAGAFCTQCEAEGFRKITYFLDRPDVLAKYDVTIVADKAQYPSLLCNGNRVNGGDLADGKHWVKWEDPFKKPCYLFALVAGDFDVVRDQFLTMSGRAVELALYVDKGNAHRGQHALDSLKKAMKWDEEVFGLEYDLDIYMIVAVDFFNMGAMENKGLNVFNSKYVLADSESATDEDYFNIESVIAHEYFHNWTGNRVTCRDWFQLSLKEGLTVFRDQQFSSDMSSPVINRIKNVRVMKEHQFAEDAGPMSHPIRPESVIEMNNFYTVTVYDKGAEVIRMMHTLLGQRGFRAGMDLYFQRYDGQAVTCDDFVQAMQDANDVDLSLFRRWYSQSGTPEIEVIEEFEASANKYHLTFKQQTPQTTDQSSKKALHIPIDLALLDKTGKAIPLDDSGNKNRVLSLTEDEQKWSFEGIAEKPVADVFREFSAPVKVKQDRDIEELLTLALHANSDYSRWDASQGLYSRLLHKATERQGEIESDYADAVMSICDSIFEVMPKDMALAAEMISIPTVDSLIQEVDVVDLDHLQLALNNLEKLIAEGVASHANEFFKSKISPTYQYEKDQVALRRLKNKCLYYLCANPDNTDLVKTQFSHSDNMTDVLAALKAAQKFNLKLFDDLMVQFEQQWRDDVLVLDKWFGLHAGAEQSDILSRLDLLTSHQQFSMENPNRVRSVVGTFAFFNTSGFHNTNSSGYRYVADAIIKLNGINPQVASRIVTPLLQFNKFDLLRQELMRTQLMRIGDTPNLSPDLFEKISKALK